MMPALQPGELVAAVSLGRPIRHFALPLEPQDRPSASLPTSSYPRVNVTAVAIVGTMLTARKEPTGKRLRFRTAAASHDLAMFDDDPGFVLAAHFATDSEAHYHHKTATS